MKKKVYKLTTADYSGVVFENYDAILEWIKADLQSNFTEVGEGFGYQIEIAEMTQEEINALPEIC